METHLQELLETIRRDGIERAEREAERIIAEAEKRAAAIVQKAQKEEHAVYANAEQRIARWRHSAEIQLRQAAANLILAIKKESVELLKKLFSADVARVVSDEEFAQIVVTAVSAEITASHQGRSAEISANPDALKKIERHLQARAEQIGGEHITLTPLPKSDLTITLAFDSEHSAYYISHESIVRTMEALLAPQLHSLLGDSSAEEAEDAK